MMQQFPIQAKSFRFKRWSRHSYAVFATLGKAVTIGSLRMHMTTRILFGPEAGLLQGIVAADFSEEDIQEDEIAAENTLLMAAMPVIANTFADAAASVVINIYPNEPRSGQLMLFRPWFFNAFFFKHQFNFCYA
jgi:hypothetical protein